MSNNLKRYYTPQGGGVTEHKAGSLYLKRDVDNLIEELKSSLREALDMIGEECPFYEGSGSYNDWWSKRTAYVMAVEDKINNG